jgi:hypothetical protein
MNGNSAYAFSKSSDFLTTSKASSVSINDTKTSFFTQSIVADDERALYYEEEDDEEDDEDIFHNHARFCALCLFQLFFSFDGGLYQTAQRYVQSDVERVNNPVYLVCQNFRI